MHPLDHRRLDRYDERPLSVEGHLYVSSPQVTEVEVEGASGRPVTPQSISSFSPDLHSWDRVHPCRLNSQDGVVG